MWFAVCLWLGTRISVCEGQESGSGDDDESGDIAVLDTVKLVLYETCSEFSKAYEAHATTLRPLWSMGMQTECIDETSLSNGAFMEIPASGIPIPGLCDYGYVPGLDAGCLPKEMSTMTSNSFSDDTFENLAGDAINGYDGLYCSGDDIRSRNFYEVFHIMTLLYTGMINPQEVYDLCEEYGEDGHMNFLHLPARIGKECFDNTRDTLLTNTLWGYPATFVNASAFIDLSYPGYDISTVTECGSRFERAEESKTTSLGKGAVIGLSVGIPFGVVGVAYVIVRLMHKPQSYSLV